MKPFEEHLRQQPIRPIPPAWRAEILAAAQTSVTDQSHASFRKSSDRLTFWQRLNSWLWPHPLAWSALAACWIAIAALNFSQPETSATVVMARKETPMTSEALTELKHERQIFAELAGPPSPPDIEPARKSKLQPRTESKSIVAV